TTYTRYIHAVSSSVHLHAETAGPRVPMWRLSESEEKAGDKVSPKRQMLPSSIVLNTLIARGNRLWSMQARPLLVFRLSVELPKPGPTIHEGVPLCADNRRCTVR